MYTPHDHFMLDPEIRAEVNEWVEDHGFDLVDVAAIQVDGPTAVLLYYRDTAVLPYYRDRKGKYINVRTNDAAKHWVAFVPREPFPA